VGTVSESETTQLFQSVAHNLYLALGLPTCIWLVDEKKQMLKIVATDGLSRDRALVDRYIKKAKLDLKRPFGASSVFVTGKLTEVLDIQAEKNWCYKQDARRMGLRSAISVPLRQRNTIIGVLDVFSHEEHRFTKYEKKLIEGFASQAARTERTLSGLSLLNQVSLLIASELQDVEALFLQVMNATQRVLECEHVTLFQVDGYGDLVLVATSSNQGIKRTRFKLGQGIAGWVAKIGRAQIIRDAAKHARFMPGLSSTLQSRSMIVVPIVSEKRVLGVISADRDRLDGFDKDDLALLEVLARHTVVALENAELFQHRDLLGTVAREITLEHDQSKLLPMILERSLELLHCKVGSIALYDDKTGHLAYEYVLGKDLAAGVTIRKGLMLAALKSGKPVCVDDVRKDKRYVARVKSTRSELDVPLMLGERAVGVLNVESPRLAAFDDAHIKAAMALAAQAAVVLTNSQLYEQTRQQLDDRINDLDQLRVINEAIGKETLSGVLQKIVELAVQLTPAQYGNLWLLDSQCNELRFGYESSKLEIPSKHPQWIPIDDHSINGHVVHTGAAYIVSDVRNDPYYQHINHDVRSELCVPLVRGNKTIGTLNLESTVIGAFKQEHERLLVALAAQSAIIIDQQRLNDKNKILLATNQAVTSTPNLDEALGKVLDETLKVFKATYGTLRMVDWSIGKKGELVLSAHRGEISPRSQDNIPVGVGITGWVAENTKALLAPDVRKDERYWDVFDRTHCEMAAPIMVGQRVIGVLNIEHYDSYAFDESDLELLTAIAYQVGTAIRNANLYKAARVASEMGIALTKGTRLPESQVLELIRTQAAQLMNMDNMFIALYDETANTIRFPIAFENGKPINIKTRKFGEGKTEEIIRTQKPLFHPTRKESEAWYKQPGKKEYVGNALSSFVGVPLLLGNRVLGVIVANHPSRDNVFSQDHLDVLQAIANEAAVALDNAHLFYRVNQRLEILVNVVRELSSGMLLQEDKILERVYEATQQLTGSRDMFVALYDKNTNEITFKLAMNDGQSQQVGVGGWVTRQVNLQERGKAEEVILTETSILHQTHRENLDWYGKPGHKEFTGRVAKSHLMVPLLARSGVIGVLAIYDWEREYAYDQTDLGLIASMANHAAIALENARLYQEARGEVVAAKQLATLGTAIAALQHRINNTFNIIVPNVTRLRSRVDTSDPTIAGILDIIERNAHYMSDIISRIQEHLGETETQGINLNGILIEIADTTQERLKQDTSLAPITIIRTLDDSIPPVQAAIGQITEVFQNLVDNACRAMKSGGTLSITSQRVDSEIQVCIVDTGSGIPPAIQGRLFKKPVPSKALGGGSGLGLWLSQLMLQRINGEIAVEKTDATGTTMLVRIHIA
jgi:GAF domain-containing protein